MTISLTRLSGGNTPADGSDPRTFPAIWNASATAIEDAIATIPEGGASVTVSETAPAGPDEGDLWLNSTEAKMYVYYDDGTSAQWVAAVGGTVPSQGKILQVVSTSKTDTFSTTSASFTGVTGLAATITPTSASSKILVTAQVSAGLSDRLMLRLSGGNTSDYEGDGGPSNAHGVMGNGGTSAGVGYNPAAGMLGYTMVFLDSPATTSSTTYQVEITQVGFGTVFVNRDSNNIRFGASSITVMEVAG